MDLNISGSGQIMPGEYDTIRVSGSGNIYINVKLTPLYEDLTSTKADDIQLALWQNEEGSIQKPRLTNVTSDIGVIKDFNPENHLIKIELPWQAWLFQQAFVPL